MLNVFICSQLMELEITETGIRIYYVLHAFYDHICFKHIGIRTDAPIYRRCFTYQDYQILITKMYILTLRLPCSN